MHPIIKEVLFNKSDIKKTVKRLAAALNEHYSDVQKPVVCIGLLWGCLPFMTDLCKLLTFPIETNFIEITSYNGGLNKTKDGDIISVNIRSKVADNHVLIIDDIIESAKSLRIAKQFIISKNPASIKSVVMVTKENHEDVLQETDWWGVKAKDVFLIGYGLDYKNSYRYLDCIAMANVDYIKQTEALESREE